MGLFSNKDKDEYAQPRPVSHARAITASAQRIDVARKSEIEIIRQRKAGDVWQSEAWEYFDAIGEVKYAARLVGAVLSRCRLYPAFVTDPDSAPGHINDAAKDTTVNLPEGMARDADRILRRLDSSNGGMAGLISRAGVNLWVAGECYLVQIPAKLGSKLPERWEIKSVDELEVSPSNSLALKTSRFTRQKQDLPEGAFAGRIWSAHPRYSDEADSSLRAVRELCDEVLLLGRAARATARSRLNAGALYLPDGLSIAHDPDEETEPTLDGDNAISDIAEEDDSFEQELMDAMTTPISDEASASAVVPLIIRGPAELADKIKHIKFERAWDPALAERADRVLERILQGLDMPKDIVAGLASVKYSNAVVIDDQLYKAHIEPLIVMICDALTEVYFRPSLEAMGYDPEIISRAMLWYDPTEILTRPDRAESANQGFDRGALSYEAWRRSHGYPEADAPTQDEMVKRAVLNRGPVTPEIATAILQILAPTLLGQVRDQSLANSPVPPLSQDAQDVLDGTSAAERPPVNPEPQPSTGPGPGSPATPRPPSPEPPTPSPNGPIP